MLEKIFYVFLATITPLSELRGGIPLGISLGLDPLFTFFLTVLINGLLYFPVIFILNKFYDNFFSKWNLFKLYLSRTRYKGKPWIDKFGFLGLALFVAIPFPLSGVYTGTVLSWLLGMNFKKTILAIYLGVFLVGFKILMATLGFISWIN